MGVDSKTGTARECLDNLYELIRRDERYFDKRDILADFCGVLDSTVHRWFTTGKMPIGGPLIKLWYYLELVGYEVTDFAEIHPTVRAAGRLVAFQVITPGYLLEFLGYATKNIDGILAILRGVRGASDEKLELLATLAEDRASELAQRQQATKNIFSEGAPSAVRAEVGKPAVIPPIRIGPQQALGVRDAVIESFAALVKTMLPLARVLNSDEFTPEDRARVRELAGGDGVFDLSVLLPRLNGEQRRSMP